MFADAIAKSLRAYFFSVVLCRFECELYYLQQDQGWYGFYTGGRFNNGTR